MSEPISLTEAQARLGELAARVTQDGEVIVIETPDHTRLILTTLDAYERRQTGQALADPNAVREHAQQLWDEIHAQDGESEPPREEWRTALEAAARLREKIYARRGGKAMTSPTEMIRQMREERDAQLLDNLR